VQRLNFGAFYSDDTFEESNKVKIAFYLRLDNSRASLVTTSLACFENKKIAIVLM
jgi:hypothetical protein